MPSHRFTVHNNIPSHRFTVHSNIPSHRFRVHSNIPSQRFTVHSNIPSHRFTIHSNTPSHRFTIHSNKPSHRFTVHSNIPHLHVWVFGCLLMLSGVNVLTVGRRDSAIDISSMASLSQIVYGREVIYFTIKLVILIYDIQSQVMIFPNGYKSVP